MTHGEQEEELGILVVGYFKFVAARYGAKNECQLIPSLMEATILFIKVIYIQFKYGKPRLGESMFT